MFRRNPWIQLGLGLVWVLLSVLAWPGLSADALPAAAPPLGITPTFTPTVTATPVATPTSTPTSTPVPVSQPTPAVGFVDPVITKRGEPAAALPGEQVTFIVEVSNRGTIAAVDVVVADEMPPYLDILEVTTTQGTLSIEGQRVTVDIGVVGPGFVVQIVIQTRVSLGAPVPLDMQNVAVLTSPNGGERQSPPVITTVSGPLLPKTGGTLVPWAVPLFGSLGLALLAGWELWRRKCQREDI